MKKKLKNAKCFAEPVIGKKPKRIMAGFLNTELSPGTTAIVVAVVPAQMP